MQPEIYLASSALAHKNYDSLETIQAALACNFSGVQLYFHPPLRDNDYRDRVIEAIRQTDLKLVLHLPDRPGVNDIQKGATFLDALPERTKILIHYLPTTGWIWLRKTHKVGWENTKVGRRGRHAQDVFADTRANGSFFAYNFARTLVNTNGNFPEGKKAQRAVTRAHALIGQLNPEIDIIQVGDLADQALCQAMCGIIFQDLKSYGGRIVVEHRNLERAIAVRDELLR